MGTTVISVVVLQNRMDLLNDELGSCNEIHVTSTLGGNEVIGTEAERVSDVSEVADQETTLPAIKTELNVSCLPVVLLTFPIGYIQICVPLYQCVLVKQNFTGKWIMSSFKKINFHFVAHCI